MKTQILSKCILSGMATMVALFCNSCQSCSKAQDECPSEKKEEPKSDCNQGEKRGCDFDKRKKDEEARGDAMIHVIEIDHPETAKVTGAKTSAKAVMGSSEEAKLEISSTPAPAPQSSAMSSNVAPVTSPVKTPANVETKANLVEAPAPTAVNQ